MRTSAQFLRVGLQWYLQLLGLISMSIALFNFLPFLPLDGGNILFALVEGVRRRAVPQVVYQRFSAVGVALILLITVIALALVFLAPVIGADSRIHDDRDRRGWWPGRRAE